MCNPELHSEMKGFCTLDRADAFAAANELLKTGVWKLHTLYCGRTSKDQPIWLSIVLVKPIPKKSLLRNFLDELATCFQRNY